MGWAEYIKKEFIFKFLADSIVSLLVLVATGLLLWILANITPVRELVERIVGFWFVVAAITFLALLAAFLVRRLSRFSPKFSRLSIDYELELFEISIEFTGPNQAIYKKRKLLRALRDGLNSFEDKYWYTGNSKVEWECESDGLIFNVGPRVGVWNRYRIDFHKTLKKGEVIEVVVSTKLKNVRQMVPFVSGTIEEPTKCLSIAIDAPPNLVKVKLIQAEVMSHIGAMRPYSSEEKHLDLNNVCKWIINRPSLLHHYQLRWSYN